MSDNGIRAITVLSGGLDSTAAYHFSRDRYDIVAAVGFDYGQRHNKELYYAQMTAEIDDIPFIKIDLKKSLRHLSRISSLVDGSKDDIPEGHYAADNMNSTVVPNRNMIMTSVAASLLPVYDAKILIMGVHSGDHPIYPDCRPEFIKSIDKTLKYSLGDPSVGIYAPFLFQDKTYAAQVGFENGMHFSSTWSCYKGGEMHCGRCGTCVERLEAIHNSGYSIYDSTPYEDVEYWKTQIGVK